MAGNGTQRELQHGVVVLATGAHSLETGGIPLRAERSGDPLARAGKAARTTSPNGSMKPMRWLSSSASGSREPERPYCSKICCTASVQQAIDLKERRSLTWMSTSSTVICAPSVSVRALPQSARTGSAVHSLHPEDQKPVVEKVQCGRKGKTQDHRPRSRSGAAGPAHGGLSQSGHGHHRQGTRKTLAKFFKVPLNQDGFFLEAHMKLRPVDFATDGVFRRRFGTLSQAHGRIHCPGPGGGGAGHDAY